MFWFPRDCPRGCVWPVSTTTPQDRERFFGQSGANRVHVMEAGWLQRVQACRLYAYRLPAPAFRPYEVGGYWVADEPVEAIERVVIDDLVGRHASAGIELRITPSIWPFWRRVANSTVEFSGSRLRNAGPHPDQCTGCLPRRCSPARPTCSRSRSGSRSCNRASFPPQVSGAVYRG
jgi:hypothetical protein